MFHNYKEQKISQRNIFSNKDAKLGHFHCFPEMLAGSGSMTKADHYVQNCLLIIKAIINSDCFSQNRPMKFGFEILKVMLLLFLFRLFVMNNRVSS